MISSEATELARKFGYLPEIIHRYIQIWGFDETKDMLEAYEKPPKPTIRVNTLKINANELFERLKKKGFVLLQSNLCTDGFIIEKTPFSLGSTTEYLSGYYFIQSMASWIPTLALNPKPGETIIDFAAAPGGKATHIAQIMNNKGILFCLDNSRERIKALRSNLARCAVVNSIIIRMDSRLFPKYKLKADKIMLDAPCSGEGLMAIDKTRRTSKTIDDILRMSQLQRELLGAALKSLKKNGMVIYSTCSTAPEENEEVIDWALTNYPIKIVEVKGENFSKGLTSAFNRNFQNDLTKACRLYPHKNGTEGFFVCKIELKEEIQ